MESPASSYALSLSDTSASDLGSRAPIPEAAATNPELKAGTPPECKGVPLFEPGDGDMKISVNGTCFEAHRYLVKRFQGLKALLDNQPQEITIQRNDVSSEDFCEMFKVLIIMGPRVFASETLVSALRVATLYEYSALRDYCVQHLETLKLDVVKRFEIAHEFQLGAWEQPAYLELGMRDGPITREEAKTIGLDAFVHIAELREKEQRRRGKEIDAMGGEQAGRSATPSSSDREESQSMQVDIQDDGPREKNSSWETLRTQLPVSGNESDADGVVAHDDTGVELNGVYNRNSSAGYAVEVPGCKCQYTYIGSSRDKKCGLPACAISALQDIQAQQSTHADRISTLESLAEKSKTSATANPASSPLGAWPTAPRAITGKGMTAFELRMRALQA